MTPDHAMSAAIDDARVRAADRPCEAARGAVHSAVTWQAALQAWSHFSRDAAPASWHATFDVVSDPTRRTSRP